MVDAQDQDPLWSNLQQEAGNLASEFVPDKPTDTPTARASRGEISQGDAIREKAAAALSPEAMRQTGEVAAYSTPILGEALSARDAYNAMQDHDWRNAAISAIGLIPGLGGIIVGRNSMHPAVAPMIQHAEELHAAGVPQDEIWRRTAATNQHPEASGAYIGSDNLPRVELDDSKARLANVKSVYPDDWFGRGPKRFIGMDHSGYQQSYGDPDYYMRGRIGGTEDMASGAYTPPYGDQKTGLIEAGGSNYDEAKAAALHELQHHISETKEGFPPGGNALFGPYDTPAENFDWYSRLPGENEAEAVAARADMNRKQRIIEPFYKSMPFPYEEQIMPDKASGGEVSEHELPHWVKPYFAAGLRAHARGEHFYGGSEQYEHELNEFKRALGGEVKYQPDEGSRSVTTVDNAGGLDPDPVSPYLMKERGFEPEHPAPKQHVERKHGGSIGQAESKKLGFIASGFERRLENVNRALVALEKRHAKQPNTKLSEKIASKRDEAERIKHALERVHAYSS